jgi:acyl transferase domain-containing protein
MEPDTSNAVAVIGMAGRFPGAQSVTDLWERLKAGESLLSRWSLPEIEDEEAAERDYLPVKGYLDGATRFRADLFDVPEAEAPYLDPQIRLLLETALQTMEDAGVPASRHDPADVGVFVASTTSEHALAAQTDRQLRRQIGQLQLKLLTDKDFAATWVSYRLNLTGPSVAVQTACSSSLVAVHLAATSVLLGECRAALAGGVCVDTDRRIGYRYVEGGIGSRTGFLRPFDEDADGAVGGNGVGLVLLKRLDDALDDGDHVHAVLLGSAMGNDGNAKVGFTAPSVDGHANVIVEAWRLAGVPIDEATYFEAHGTGTRLGDPIEAAALRQARGEGPARRVAALGSIKGNVGHLDTAAGVAGLIKAVLVARERTLVATPGLRTPARDAALPSAGLRVQGHAERRPSESGPVYVGVSSLGIGGTNVHAVVTEAPGARAEEAVDAALLPLSTATAGDHAEYAQAVARAVAGGGGLAGVARTLQTGRVHRDWRSFAVARDSAHAAPALESRPVPTRARPRRVTFLFPGQTARYTSLGRNMYDRYPVYRAAVEQFAEVLEPFGVDPCDWGAGAATRGTDWWQPSIVAHQLALLRLLRHHGIGPDCVIGHSVGEFSAAVAIGAVGEVQALQAVARRGVAMNSTDPGRMLAVKCRRPDLDALGGTGAVVAAHNADDRYVLAGTDAEIAAVRSRLDNIHGVTTRLLDTDRAFHSHLMETALPAVREAMNDFTREMRDCGGTWISTATGGRESVALMQDPEYWVRQVVRPVLFADAIAAHRRAGESVDLEVGAGGELTFLGLSQPGPGVLSASLQGRQSDTEVVDYLTGLGTAWASGIDLAWGALAPRAKKAVLPGHPLGGPDVGALRLGDERPARAMDAPRATESALQGTTRQTATVASVFAGVLGATEASLDRSASFLGLGGDSLKAVQVVGRLRDELDIELGITDLLSEETLAALIERLDASDALGPDAALLRALEALDV